LIDVSVSEEDSSHHLATDGEKTLISIEVKGKTLSFAADKDYIEKQTIEPPCERLKLQWV
jgi:hypothetical protein